MWVLFVSNRSETKGMDSLEKGLVEVMKCPYCGNQKTKVIDSRSAEEGNAIAKAPQLHELRIEVHDVRAQGKGRAWWW